MDALSLILDPLNPEQRRAVETVEGPVLILAGAGSGKTRALTHRIAYLIERGVPAWQILAVTFTNKAANEMKERIKRLIKLTSETGDEHAVMPVMGTFHSVCVRMLRRDIEHIGRNRDFVIYDTDDQDKLMKETLLDLKILPEDIKPRTALAHIGRFKSEAMSVRDVQSEATTSIGERFAKIYAHYQAKLRDANALDFDDLILETVRLLKEVPIVLHRYQETWKFLNIDEYQDTNHAQYLLVSLLANKYKNLCAIGDPDQSIYAFRGADIRNILEFKKEYPQAISIALEQNYRSTQPILSAANAVIAVNPNRPEKNMWSEKKEGPKIVLEEVNDERIEAEHAIRHVLDAQKNGIPLNDQVILYRTNAQSRQFEEACLRSAVPYRILGGLKFYMRREVKDVLAYLYTILNPQDTISLLRIINIPSRKIGQTTLLKLKSHCADRGLTLWQGLLHIEMVEGLPDATKQKLSQFSELILDLQKRAKEIPVSDVMHEVLQRTGMEKWVRDETEEGEERWQNIEELLSVAKKYDSLEPWTSLTSFLEEVALVSEVDKLDQVRDDALTLMTVHLCKGLEFESVTIAGAEEGIFPVSAALFDREQLEEERRLMYVAMTRAKTHLRIFHARSRILWGNTQSNARSRFLDDLPPELTDAISDDLLSRFAWGTGNTKKRSSIEPYRQDADVSPWADDMNQDHETNLEPGTRIAHPTFGPGIIKSVRGDILEVEFESGKTKHLAANIAPITLAP